MKQFTTILFPALVAFLALGLTGCGDEKDDDLTPTPPDNSAYEASAILQTNQQATIQTESGAALQVPFYAVPPTETGGPGVMVFSIEKAVGVTPVLPAGHTLASDVYRFGPDGFTFAEMVNLKIPIKVDTTGKSFALQRINPTSGISEMQGGALDLTTLKVAALTYHLSSWYITSYTATNTAWGAFKITNLSSTHWLKLCVEAYDLKYPDADANFDGAAECMFAPTGTIGWANSGLWYLPQGTYTLCVSMNAAGTLSTPPGDPVHWNVEAAQLNSPWTRSNPVTTDLSFSESSPSGVAGACDCVPTPSTSVGTGDVQVTLTWANAQPIDLDLWVTDPSGVRCYYGNTPTVSGGQLDRDNTCGSYINGRPENIFWADAPLGQYIVQVDLYSACGTGVTSQTFTVRVVAGGTVKTYSGTVTTSHETVQVATFTMSAGAAPAGYGAPGGPVAAFGDYQGTPIARPSQPPKL